MDRWVGLGTARSASHARTAAAEIRSRSASPFCEYPLYVLHAAIRLVAGALNPMRDDPNRVSVRHPCLTE